jgi:predicted RNA-binding protein Jag
LLLPAASQNRHLKTSISKASSKNEVTFMIAIVIIFGFKEKREETVFQITATMAKRRLNDGQTTCR